MPILDLIPWKRKESEEEGGGALQVSRDPFLTFQGEMNRMFDDFFRGGAIEPFGAFREGLGAFRPSLDVVETEDEIKVSVELPGMEETDIDVQVAQNVLTIGGEKSQEKEETGQSWVRTERSYGSFRRQVPLSSEVDVSKSDAVFRKGVLTVTLPKEPAAKGRKRVTVKS
jgi:HSP20 family protein